MADIKPEKSPSKEQPGKEQATELPPTPAPLLHRFLVRLAYFALWSFFRDVRVLDVHNLPATGPVIVACTHHNSALDPTVLSTTYPRSRWFHYWAKSSLFSNPFLKWLMLSAGNIPVDRGNKDKRSLFQGTIDVLGRGDAVAVFPEGTSYTEPSIVQVKDGAAWCALEYTSHARDLFHSTGKALPEVVIVPASVVYTNKSKYRSAVILQFAPPLHMSPYMESYLSPTEGSARKATKALTHALERAMISISVNAPDWETLNAGRMAREILWVEEREIALEEFTIISQTLVDLFTPPYPSPQTAQVKQKLLTYFALLQASRLSHYTLSQLPLPRTLDPRRPTPLPSRLGTLLLLLRDTLAALVRLPFFLLPLLVHLPIYLVGAYVQRLIPDEEEIAQGKVFLGLFILMGTYGLMFLGIWMGMWMSPLGGLVAAVVVWAFAVYHVQLVDQNYDSMKRLLAAWRVLIGLWTPESWDIALSQLQLSAKPDKPENQYIKKRKSAPSAASGAPSPTGGAASPSPTGGAASPSPTGGAGSPSLGADSRPTSPESPSSGLRPESPLSPTSETEASSTPKPFKKKKKLPSRRLVRHVLRHRVIACQALFQFLSELERTDGRVTASPHLARMFGRAASPTSPSPTPGSAAPEPASSPAGAAKSSGPGDTTSPEEALEGGPNGWRSGREVVNFLRARGAGVKLVRGPNEWSGGLTSEGEETWDEGEE